jgi:two-component system chemotaxis response regulator CheB
MQVLIVDDSRLYRARLRQIIEEAQGLEVAAEATNGEEAVRMVREHTPDFIVMDVIMPIMDGITAVRAILSERSVPILVFTAADGDDRDLLAFEALEAGALDVLPKPRNSGPKEFLQLAEDLPERILALSKIQVMAQPPQISPPGSGLKERTPLFLIGASTGGPQAINTVLRELPSSFLSTILVVQHISHGFLPGLVHWLSRECRMQVEIARHGQIMLPGHVYFAPTQKHLEFRGDQLLLTDGPPRNGCKPSADVLFGAAEREGRDVVGIVLTGMGSDGLEGARTLNRLRHNVLVQSPRTCAVAGMPTAIIEAGQATQVLELTGITREMIRLSEGA